jgi:hypothetical protein
MEKLHLRSPSLQEPFHHYPKLMCNVLEKKNNSNPKKPNNSNNKLGIAIFYSISMNQISINFITEF